MTLTHSTYPADNGLMTMFQDSNGNPGRMHNREPIADVISSRSWNAFLTRLSTLALGLTFASYFLVFCGMVLRHLTVSDFPLPAVAWGVWAVIFSGVPVALFTQHGKTYRFRAHWTQALLLSGLVFGMLNSGMAAITLFNIPLIALFGLIFFSIRTAIIYVGAALAIVLGFTVAHLLDALPTVENAEFWLNSDYRWLLRSFYFAIFSAAITFFLHQYVAYNRHSVQDLHVLQEAIDEAPDAFVVWDADDRLFLSNRRYQNLQPGLKPHLKKGVSFEETLRVGLQLGMYPEASGHEEQWLANRIKLHEEPESSRVLQLGDGRWMRILESRTSSGFLAGFRTDITQLRDTEDLLKATLDSVSEAIITLSADFQMRNINAATTRIFGFKAYELIGKSIWDIHPNADIAALENLGASLQSQTVPTPTHVTVTLELKRKNEEKFAARVEMTAITLAGEPVFVLAITDLSERRIYEGTNQALGAALEQLDVGFMLLNDLDEAQFVNQQFIQLFGPHRAPVIVKSGEHITQVLRAICQSTAHLHLSNDKTSPYRGLLKFYYNPRGLLNLKLGNRRLVLAGQQLEGGFTSLRLTDVTDTVEQAAQLEQATKLATLGEMAAGIAHELNQPLQAIKLTAASALRRLQKDPEKARTTTAPKLEQIIGQIDRAATITDHMRKSARLASEDTVSANVLEVISDTYLLVESSLRLSRIEWRTDLPETLPDCKIHPVRLEQVLLNLFNNARDALVERKSSELAWLSVSAQILSSEDVEIVVEDSAGGIPEDVINRVFDPFYTTKAVGKGTGLGLSISYQIVTDAEGTLSVQNTRYGARFVIVLPTDRQAFSSQAN